MSVTDATALREFIIEHFDLEELRTLCQDLEVDFDSLRGEGKEGKARELVAYMERHVRLDDLIVALEDERPNAGETLEHTSEPQAPVREGTSYGERVRMQLKGLLQDPVWQGIGGVAAVLALMVAIGTWFWPNISTLSLAQPTPTPGFTSTPSTTPKLTVTPAPRATSTSQGLLPPSARMRQALIGVTHAEYPEFRGMGFAVSNTPYLVAGMTTGQEGDTVNFKLATEPTSAVYLAMTQASNDDLSIALLKPVGASSIRGVPLASSNRLEVGDKVHIYSLRQGFVKGTVEELNAGVTVPDYDDGRRRDVQMSGMLKTSSISVGGDIGSPVFDEQGKAVGIVVAGSGTTGFQ